MSDFIVVDIPPYKTSAWNQSTIFNGSVSVSSVSRLIPLSAAQRIANILDGTLSTKANWGIGRPSPTYYHSTESRLLAKVQWSGFWFKRARVWFYTTRKERRLRMWKFLVRRKNNLLNGSTKYTYTFRDGSGAEYKWVKRQCQDKRGNVVATFFSGKTHWFRTDGPAQLQISPSLPSKSYIPIVISGIILEAHRQRRKAEREEVAVALSDLVTNLATA